MPHGDTMIFLLRLLSNKRNRRKPTPGRPENQKAWSFIEAHQAVKALNLSRGFYPYSPSSKGCVFKIKKGKGKSKAEGKRLWFLFFASGTSGVGRAIVGKGAVHRMSGRST